MNQSSALRYGAALTSLTFMGISQAATLNPITFTPSVVAFNNNQTLQMSTTGGMIGELIQFNTSDTAFGRGMLTTGTVSNVLGGLNSGDLVSAGMFTTSYVAYGAVFANQTKTVAFRTGANNLGWVRIQFGPVGGDVTYLAGGYNPVAGESINAGQLGSPSVIPEPASIALCAAGLALLAGGGFRRRQRQEGSVTA